MLSRRDERRPEQPEPRIFAIADRDFDRLVVVPEHGAPDPEPWKSATGRPERWALDGNHIGWLSERKELENYLLDPLVVSGALGLDDAGRTEYEAALEAAADGIHEYQAARTALACAAARLRTHAVSARWGGKTGDHTFPDRASRTESACREHIARAYETYLDPRFDQARAETLFDALLPDFMPGGARRVDYLTTFAGKDLLCALNEVRPTVGLGSQPNVDTPQLCALVLKGLNKLRGTARDAAMLPEWQVLVQEINLA